MLAAAQVRQRTTAQNAQQGTQGHATIEGTVTRSDNGQPLKNARVTLRSSNRGQNAALGNLATAGAIGTLVNLASAVATVTTDGNGRFTLTGVAAGQYQISSERDGFIRSEYGQRTPTGRGVSVQIADSQHLMIDLKMLQASVISGRVITADGEPAAQTTVQAYAYQYSNGQRTLAEVKTAQTNDLGEYRLFWLEPGDYFVSVTNNQVTDNVPIGTVDVSQTRGRGGANVQILTAALADRGGPIVQALGGATNPPVFYPGTVDPDGATPITVVAASDVRGMDFNLRPLRTASVSGRVVAPFPLNQPNTAVGGRGRGGVRQGADGNPVQIQIAGAPVQLSLNRVGGSRTGLLAEFLSSRLGATQVSPDGTFEIKGVAPGEYNLMATARDQSGQQYTARTRISVGTADVTNVTVAVRPGIEVGGRILLDGTPPQQFKFSNLRVSLVGEDGGLTAGVNLVAGGRGDALVANLLGGGQGIAATTVADDGSFTVKDVGAQEYRVRVTGLPQGAYVQAGRIGSNDALNAAFTIDNPGTQLQIQLGFSPGRVSGNVTDDRGAPVTSVQTVLVPDEARRGRNDAYFTATTDQNGQFTFNNVAPGRYKIFSWEDIPAGAYQYPDFLRRYEDRGQALTVNANGAITANVRLIPAN